jgi:predicted GIY-YIG superfamily endonuclease
VSRGRPFKPREHGTERGYQQHRHLREPYCEECRRAHAENNRGQQRPARGPLSETRFFVYHLFDGEGVLLYIGCSDMPTRRRYQHRRGQPWGHRVCGMTMVGPFNLEDGLAAEAEAIRTEQPVYNVQHRDPIAEQVAS